MKSHKNMQQFFKQLAVDGGLVLHGSAHKLNLPDDSVHCAVSSPVYFGMRKYKGHNDGSQSVNWSEFTYRPHPHLPYEYTVDAMDCPLGWEPDVLDFLGHLVLIYDEVYRVLRKDGVCWVNIGDTSMSGGRGKGKALKRGQSSKMSNAARDLKAMKKPKGFKKNNTFLIPEMFVLAMQARGWVVRPGAIWRKPNTTPESVYGTHWKNGKLRQGAWRFTSETEDVFMLTKQSNYWADQESVREPYRSLEELKSRKKTQQRGEYGGNRRDMGRDRKDYYVHSGRNPRTITNPELIDLALIGLSHLTLEEMAQYLDNPTNVLNVNTASYIGAHYAVFPPKLIEPLIKSTCPSRCCGTCGAGFAPEIKVLEVKNSKGNPNDVSPYTAGETGSTNGTGTTTLHKEKTLQIGELLPTCKCKQIHKPEKGVVIDVFGGSGTTAAVAESLERYWIYNDVQPDYEPLLQQRLDGANDAVQQLSLLSSLEEKIVQQYVQENL